MLKSTKRFLKLLRENKFKVSLTENYAGKADAITLGVNGKFLKPVKIAVFLYTNEFESSVQCGIERIKENKAAECLSALNELNRKYKWARFTLEPNLSVVCEIDVTATTGTIIDITFQMLVSMIRTADEAYAYIKQFEDETKSVTDEI